MALTIRAAVLVALAALCFGAGWLVKTWKGNSDAYLINTAAAAGADRASAAAVSALAGMRPTFDRIRNEVKRATAQEPRYIDPGCSHTPDAWLRLSDAYEAAGGPPLDRGDMRPAPAPAR